RRCGAGKWRRGESNHFGENRGRRGLTTTYDTPAVPSLPIGAPKVAQFSSLADTAPGAVPRRAAPSTPAIVSSSDDLIPPTWSWVDHPGQSRSVVPLLAWPAGCPSSWPSLAAVEEFLTEHSIMPYALDRWSAPVSPPPKSCPKGF